MIYTLTLNPAVDRELTVPAVEFDTVLRAAKSQVDFGGKGFNVSRLLKGLIDAVVLIHDPSAKTDIVEILRKAFRFPKPQDAEASYKVLTIMATLDMTPDPNAWKLVQKITARINPKVAQVDLSQVLNPLPMRSLEESGFLAEARKKLR